MPSWCSPNMRRCCSCSAGMVLVIQVVCVGQIGLNKVAYPDQRLHSFFIPSASLDAVLLFNTKMFTVIIYGVPIFRIFYYSV